MLIRHNPSTNLHRARRSDTAVDLDDVQITVVDDEPTVDASVPLVNGRMRRLNLR